MAEALQAIHAADVIRDLKPSNIILTAEGPKVIDFGIARAADVTTVTATGMRTGTPAYMAPEYIRGQSVTEAGDVFALGVVAHFAATGRLAFGGGTGGKGPESTVRDVAFSRDGRLIAGNDTKHHKVYL